MSHEVYYLPVSFTSAERVFGLFEVRNLAGAVLLTLPLLHFCMILLPLSLTPKFITTMVLVVPVGGFTLIGISDDSLTWWLGCQWRQRWARKVILF